MNRFLIPVTATALAAGVAIPGFFGRRTVERVVAGPVQTVVREVYHETPVVYRDTVYMAEETAPVQPVYVQNEYNEYNEYNHTDVYVHKQVTVPPPHPRGPGWSPRYREQQPRDRSGYDKPRERRDEPDVPMPKPQVKRAYSPATNDRQKSLVPPIPLTPPYQPVLPKRQPPAQGGVPVNPMPHETPRQVPTPPAHKSLSPGVDAVQGQAGTDQAGTSPLAARLTK
jgi:hypothetical protein